MSIRAIGQPEELKKKYLELEQKIVELDRVKEQVAVLVSEVEAFECFVEYVDAEESAIITTEKEKIAAIKAVIDSKVPTESTIK